MIQTSIRFKVMPLQLYLYTLWSYRWKALWYANV
uniref:Uncharacterized protein n=1 Tax=Anguilla anguilla TaxID=7936 RepID=A0A0E9XCC7_ANGAN